VALKAESAQLRRNKFKLLVQRHAVKNERTTLHHA
jgi:hypothetical protein